MHGSASPFEAFAERCNWTQVAIENDTFGKALLSSGVSKEELQGMMSDAQVVFNKKKQSTFDLLEDLDVEDCYWKVLQIAKSNE